MEVAAVGVERLVVSHGQVGENRRVLPRLARIDGRRRGIDRADHGGVRSFSAGTVMSPLLLSQRHVFSREYACVVEASLRPFVHFCVGTLSVSLP